MLLDVETFRKRTAYELDSLVEDLSRATARAGNEEKRAWRSSLPAFAQVLSHESLRGLHVHVRDPADVLVEYRLPASPSWADIVLLGRGRHGPAAVVVELKDWDVRGDLPGETEGVVYRRSRPCLHPSDQVRGYAEYCQRFHSVVQESGATVSGCVFFTFASSVDCYEAAPHESLVDSYPVFARNAADMESRLPEFLLDRLAAPDADFARRFEAGVYRQDRGFVTQIAAAIREPAASPFVLLDQQRLGFHVCLEQVARIMRPAHATARAHDRKSVVLVHGPPGSGKSVIGAHLWATIGSDSRVDGNVVITTTSASQRTNWEALFERVAGSRAARGVVIGANGYNPGLSQRWLSLEREAGRDASVRRWRENLARYGQFSRESRCPDNTFAVSIVDEAHALIDPSVPGKAGIAPSGWLLHAGPQAWHIIRASRVSVFLLDSDQSYRDNETTTPGQIRAFAAEFGATVTEVDLRGSQFRCGGSVEYTDWLDHDLLAVERHHRPARGAAAWRPGDGGPFEFRIASDPADLESLLRRRLEEGRSARLVASYARPWRTRVYDPPHAAPEAERDFVISVRRDGADRVWSRVWNHVPAGQDYSYFIQAPPGSPVERDPLCEVGCPYVVRGFDFDYVGLLWLSDLVWRTDRWVVQIDHVHESAWRLTRAAVRRRSPGAEEAIVRLLLRGYRILLTRAIRGTYVWFEDEETRERVARLAALR